MSSSRKKGIIIGVVLACAAVVALLALAGAALAVAEEPDVTKQGGPEKDEWIDELVLDQESGLLESDLVDLNAQRLPGPGAREFMDEALAETLDITVEELQAAREEARIIALDRAVEEGHMARDRAELLKAVAALAKTVDRDEVIVEVLGITVEELQSAREEGKVLRDLVKELGLDRAELAQKWLAVRESVIEQAANDDVITDEQADLLLARPRLGLNLFYRPRSSNRCCCISPGS